MTCAFSFSTQNVFIANALINFHNAENSVSKWKWSRGWCVSKAQVILKALTQLAFRNLKKNRKFEGPGRARSTLWGKGGEGYREGRGTESKVGFIIFSKILIEFFLIASAKFNLNLNILSVTIKIMSSCVFVRSKAHLFFCNYPLLLFCAKCVSKSCK